MFGYPLPLPLEALAIKLTSGFSPLITVVGDETGIGKSMFTLWLAEKVYYRAFGQIWKPKGNLFFRMKDFKLELFKSMSRIFIIEESEIELGSDHWQSIQNKYFSRMKSTQRIKGNLYIVVLPIFMLLAKKHRIATNYIFDIKGRGYCHAFKIKKRASQLLGDEMSKFYLGAIKYPMPSQEVVEQFMHLDKLNKNRIEEDEGQALEMQLKLKKAQENKIVYEYECELCKFVWRTKSYPNNKRIQCKRCRQMVFLTDDNPKVIRFLA